MNDNYRNLSPIEIETLKKQGCECENWREIEVKDGFDAKRVRDTVFSGRVKMGIFNIDMQDEAGLAKPVGIYSAVIHNCTIGNNVRISNIGEHIANYAIESDCRIENTESIAVTEETTFGNGLAVEVINEGGGRKIQMFEEMTSQIAYIQAVYKHREKLQLALWQIINKLADKKRGSVGQIGKGSKIIGAGVIRNVNVGVNCVIKGASELFNGTIRGDTKQVTMVGRDVIARNFIIREGAEVSDGVILSDSFVGQCCVFGKGFSAENSVFFANCEMLQGEGCSVFCGPYSVSHHKSTLLIAGMFSFFNAGSGTNQSNHLYKAGPVHQGVLERGCKTGSESYLLWPSRVGPFCVVIGKHYRHLDIGDMPFSYVLDDGGESLLVPGVNLRSVGTFRDSVKWVNRDKRKTAKADIIDFELFNPFTVERILQAEVVLKGIDTSEDEIDFRGMKLYGKQIEKALRLYSTAVDIFVGYTLLKYTGKLNRLSEFRKSAEKDIKWCDISGMVAAYEDVEELCDQIEDGQIEDIAGLVKELSQISKKGADRWFCYALAVLAKRQNIKTSEIDLGHIAAALKRYKEACGNFEEIQLLDAGKEFIEARKAGYGLDGDEEIRQKDFEAVRGVFETGKLAQQIKEKYAKDRELADRLLGIIEKR